MDRNHDLNLDWIIDTLSLSARRAWIEISKMIISVSGLEVALRKESVDRNMGASYGRTAKMVALRKESVDRNNLTGGHSTWCCVALRKESVDRNHMHMLEGSIRLVALRKESVDRNQSSVSLDPVDI